MSTSEQPPPSSAAKEEEEVPVTGLLTANKWWVIGAAVAGLCSLMVVPIAAVGLEVGYLNSLESLGESTVPTRKRFDVIYWPLTVAVMLVWGGLLLVNRDSLHGAVWTAMWKMLGVYLILAIFSYFMHVAGKNYVIQHTPEIQMDKNLQMSAILSTFTVVIYLAGTVALMFELYNHDKPKDLQQAFHNAVAFMRKKSEIGDWPGKIERIAVRYERLIHMMSKTLTPDTLARKRDRLVEELKKVYDVKSAYNVLRNAVNDDEDLRPIEEHAKLTFLVNCMEIISESSSRTAQESMWDKLSKRFTALPPQVLPQSTTTKKKVPEIIEHIEYKGPYFNIYVEAPDGQERTEDIILFKNTFRFRPNQVEEKPFSRNLYDVTNGSTVRLFQIK